MVDLVGQGECRAGGVIFAGMRVKYSVYSRARNRYPKAYCNFRISMEGYRSKVGMWGREPTSV